jgi:hypothetical protein
MTISLRLTLLRVIVVTLATAFWGAPADADAQTLTPRAYWPAPKGSKVAGFSYQYSWGDVLVDPTLPATEVDSSIHVAQFSYTQVISLAGRSSNLQFSVPYTWSETSGLVEGQVASRSLSAVSDAQARLSINLWGAPTMDVDRFQELRAAPRPIIGASLLVQIPIGRYDEDFVINAGTNRWALKPALGLILPLLPTWLLEVEVGAWFFTDNDQFLGTTREQSSIVSTEFHLVKRIRPGFWAALDANFYFGGRTTVGGDVRADLQRNSRVGATLAFPFYRSHAIRGSFSFGAVTESGGDFRTATVSYLYVWH